MTPIEQQIEGIVDSILEDYRHGRDIDKLDPFQHPDKTVVIDMGMQRCTVNGYDVMPDPGSTFFPLEGTCDLLVSGGSAVIEWDERWL